MASCALTRDEIVDLIKANELHITSSVTGGGSTTLTRNDGETFVFPSTDVIETDDNFVITVGEKQIVIPKCNFGFYDCNENEIVQCRDRIVTCSNLQDKNYLSSVYTDNSIFGNGTENNKLGTNADLIPYEDEDWFLNKDAPTVGIALDQLSDFLKIAFGEDLIILNNPTFYVRQITGSANPTITSQSDLTEANAFNSFTSMKNFIKNTYIIGKITIDARGSFELGVDNLIITPEDFKNSTSIDIKGDPNNPEAFKIRTGFDTRTRRWAFRNCNSVIKDFTIEFGDVSQIDGGTLCGVEVSNNAEVRILGNVKVKGMHNRQRANAPGSSIFRSVNNGKLFIGQINEKGLRLEFDLLTGANFNYVFDCSYNGRISFLPVEYVFTSSFSASTLFGITANSQMLFNGDYINPIETNTKSGSGIMTLEHSSIITKLSYMELFQENMFFGGDAANWVNTFFPISGTSKILIDKNSIFKNKYGSDLTANTNFAVV